MSATTPTRSHIGEVDSDDGARSPSSVVYSSVAHSDSDSDSDASDEVEVEVEAGVQAEAETETETDDGTDDGTDDDDPCESAFDRLPDEIIQQVLLLTDPDSFASLILINSKWRRISQQGYLYAHHLGKCPSYAASHVAVPLSSVTDKHLPRLRSTFAGEVKRNLFEAYLRPSETRITLVSTAISSSSCPGGEGLQFTSSPNGHQILAYNSSRIYVIDVCEPDVRVKREFKILRRPVSVCIQDDASLLAVLSSDMQIDVFNLKHSPPKRLQSIVLDNRPRTMALSPCGSVLAAAYEGGIEVTSLNPDSLTAKRAVKCEPVDSLTFSPDGTQLLGTTTHSQLPNTVILTAPYYDPGTHMSQDNVSALWTTSILFPNISRDCSHAILLQDSDGEEASWTFTYDRSFETFRAVRIDDLRNGTTYFTGPTPTSQSRLLPCTLPSSTYDGDLVSAGFQGKEVWLYGIPEDLSAVPDQPLAPYDGGLATSGSGRRAGGHSPRFTPRTQGTDQVRAPKWQALCDTMRNTFVSGKQVAQLEGVSCVKWVAGFGGSTLKERLVIAARGVNPNASMAEEDDIDFIDGGRITLLDFDYGMVDGKRTDITIEVGTTEPEPLEEEQRDMATEVALVRRRTVAQRRGNNRTTLDRGATIAVHPPLPLPTATQRSNNDDDDDDPLQPRRVGVAPRVVPRFSVPDEGDEAEEQEALDAPYTQATPRSVTTLRRAATAAAMSRRLRPTLAAGVEYRRADGRTEHPHESDADNWVPPPPPYQADAASVDLPAFLRHPAITPAALASQAPPAPATSSGVQQQFQPRQPLGFQQQQQQQPQPQPQPQRQQQQQQPQQQQLHNRLPLAGRYHWPQVPLFPRNVSDPVSPQLRDRPLPPLPNMHYRISDVVSPVERRTSIPRPRSDSISDHYIVSPLDVPASRHLSRRRTRPWDGDVPDRGQSQSPVSDSAVDSLSHRFSIDPTYSNPLGLNPPFEAGRQTGAEQGGPPPGEQPAAAPRQPRQSGRDGQRPGPPTLDLQIPSPTIYGFQRSSTWGASGGDGGEPVVAGFQRHSTWGSPSGDSEPSPTSILPRNPPGSLGEMLATGVGPSDLTSYPRSAPARASDDSINWPSAPRFHQPDLAGDRSRGKQPEHTFTAYRPPSPPDQPLIVSTPAGVSGAFDDPATLDPSSNGGPEATIFAPRPRRNVNPHNPHTPGPTVTRLENLFTPSAGLSHSASAASRHAKLDRRRSRLRRSGSRRSVARSVRRVRMRPAMKRNMAAGLLEEGITEDDKGGKKCIVM
ncbi:uncharacterized protein DNG_03620 [Cephalotrichum gorgonifer]|uniref:F-box domain-containing protein n=1 Tax=Cephalotrichum gorgonifer TaxID=2041049 RepID=A0AAE8MWJ9_9PEZI|nr:uncharacterized protein DNG_03620 [Cephalotrichum gorgonifer]